MQRTNSINSEVVPKPSPVSPLRKRVGDIKWLKKKITTQARIFIIEFTIVPWKS